VKATASPALLLVPAALVALATAACRTEQTLVKPDPHLERMLDQPKTMPYAREPLLPDEAAMQRPPDGTMTADADRRAPGILTGISGGAFVDRIPVRVDRAMLETGRARYEVFCAPCHGVLGDGDSSVARVMALRKPVNLHVPPASTDAPGEQFHTVRNGYGLMPSYAVQLSVDDAWAVVAYLQALRLSQHAVVAELPPETRAYLARELP
jgi:mono/diheme cytochrome c family protein